MLLISGATGFIGRRLLRRLQDEGRPARLLLRPGRATPALPPGQTFQVTLTSLRDRRGVRAALAGVEAVIHLAGGGWSATSGYDLDEEVEGTEVLAQEARAAGVRRMVYLSHLGAAPNSAYPGLRAKGLAEQAVRKMGPAHTILRTSVVFGAQDHFTVPLARLIRFSPGFFLLPGDGQVQIQPLWVEDLVSALLWSLDLERTENGTFEIGGPEYFTFRQVVEVIMATLGVHRALVPTRQPYLRMGARVLERLLRQPPVTTLWLDYLAVHRMADLDTLPQVFGLQPARLEDCLGYLRKKRKGAGRKGRLARGSSDNGRSGNP